jgi:ABC-type sugar transport system ATPase subunit
VADSGGQALLQVEGLTVEFPGVRALDSVHFDVVAGAA